MEIIKRGIGVRSLYEKDVHTSSAHNRYHVDFLRRQFIHQV